MKLRRVEAREWDQRTVGRGQRPAQADGVLFGLDDHKNYAARPRGGPLFKASLELRNRIRDARSVAKSVCTQTHEESSWDDRSLC